MQAQMTQEQESTKLKAHFYNLMSYEFRTCLNTILLSVEFLEAINSESAEDEEQGEYIQHIRVAAEHMRALLNEATNNFPAE